jgi:cobalamin synthase
MLSTLIITGLVGFIAYATEVSVSIAIVGIARRRFRGLTGDVMEAVNEISRGVALVAVMSLS